jgi:signal transduction histidine kinase
MTKLATVLKTIRQAIQPRLLSFGSSSTNALPILLQKFQYSSIALMVLITNLGIGGILLCTFQITHVPWLGFTLTPTEIESSNYEILSVSPGGPAANILRVGEKIKAIGTIASSEHFQSIEQTASIIEVNQKTNPFEPDTLLSFEEYNSFFIRQNELHRIIKQPQITIFLENREENLAPGKVRPLSDLPAQFWVNMGFALLCLLIGAVFYVSQQNNLTARWIFLGSIGFYLNSITHGIYMNREITVSGNLFKLLCDINHVGLLVFAYSMLIVFLTYPNRVTKFPVEKLACVWCSFIVINESYQLVSMPVHPFYYPYILAIIIAPPMIYFQWRQAKNNPVERAVVTWLFCSVSIASTITVLLMLVPVIYNESPIISPTQGQILIFIAYLGIILGAVKYRLFEVETWWRRSWYWFFGAILIIILDMSLATFLNYNHSLSLSISVLVVSLIWFPLRQLLYRQLLQPKESAYYPFIALIESAFKFDESIEDAWKYLLKETLKPSSIEEINGQINATQITNSGLSLKVSGGEIGKTLILSGKQLNRSLFSPVDVKLVDLLKETFDNIFRLKNEKEHIREIERSRIMQDLHDDVCPSLLDLSRKVTDPALKDSALNSYNLLRDTIYLLSEDTTWDLEELILSWKRQTYDRLESNSIALSWSENIETTPTQIGARHKINIERIIRESITNILKHSRATHVHILATYLNKVLSFTIQDNGICNSLDDFSHGNGIHNMKRRLGDMGSQLHVRINDAQDPACNFGVEIFFSIDLSKLSVS